uniref:Protein kinase domain-containing protein n=1 Tax=Haptolina brevifila TaxID=156173 RepID=A0A7S2CRK6_9EUKA|mmetsp:Transcript_27902/g.56159  ORF Transcript_27902/g.56159 Transcript_27902/m.56159 type:complete len:235 (+) Transcript_27902:209-913(+)
MRGAITTTTTTTMLSLAMQEVILQQAYGKPVDAWSFGCLLSHMGARVAPFAQLGRHASAQQVMTQVVGGELTPLDALKPSNCPALLIQLARECVSVDANARPLMAAIAARLAQPDMRAAVRPVGGLERPVVPLHRPAHPPLGNNAAAGKGAATGNGQGEDTSEEGATHQMVGADEPRAGSEEQLSWNVHSPTPEAIPTRSTQLGSPTAAHARSSTPGHLELDDQSRYDVQHQYI